MKIILILLIRNAFSSSTFPMDSYLQTRVNFWKRVYTEISTEEGFLHDEDDLGIIYQKVNLKGLSEKSKYKQITEKKKRWAKVITSSIKKITPEELAIIKKIKGFGKVKLMELAKNIRFQSGLSNQYFHGLEESYKYLKDIKEEFRKMGLPLGLAYLPHVESSFNYKAYSKVGAVGIWQFMWPTARLYKLNKNYLLDERRDPLLSTKAAGRHLLDNYKRFNSWPLAITAYNSGPNTLAQAISRIGSKDLSQILKKYERGRFRFASKNFYATFLAVLEISNDPTRYFKKFKKRSHPPLTTYLLPEKNKVSRLAKVFNLNLEEIESHNLSIRPYVFKRDLYLPKGFPLKIPKHLFEKAKMVKISTRPVLAHHKSYKIKVEANETLGHYADWSLIPKEKILRANPKVQIRAGSIVYLPEFPKNLDRFLKKRNQFHLTIQKLFFKRFKIKGTERYQVQKGDTLDKITDKLELPLWLIKKYKKNETLKIGETLDIPRIVEVNDKFQKAQNQ